MANNIVIASCTAKLLADGTETRLLNSDGTMHSYEAQFARKKFRRSAVALIVDLFDIHRKECPFLQL